MAETKHSEFFILLNISLITTLLTVLLKHCTICLNIKGFFFCLHYFSMENVLLAFISDTLLGTVIADLFIDFQAMY